MIPPATLDTGYWYILSTMHDDADRIRLFPLGLVLFPGLPLPLHVFEERYKQLVAECVESDEPFGIVYVDESGMKRIGCTARVEDIVKRHPDGKLDILTRGERRFELLEVESEEPYAVGRIEYLESLPDTVEVEEPLERAIGQLRRLARITGSLLDLETLRRMDASRISYLISGLDAFTPGEKQLLLELPSTSQRLAACAEALARAVKTYDVERDAKELIPGGKLLHRFN